MGDLKYLNKFFWQYKKLFFLGIFFVSISNIFAVYPAEFVRDAIDAIFDKKNNIRENIYRTVIFYSMLIIGFAILKGVFMYLMRQTIIVMSRRIEYDLKNEIYYHYQKLNTAFYKKNKTGDLMNRISEDVSRVRMYLGPCVMYTVNIIILFSLIIFKMVLINIKLTLYVILPLPILAFSVYYVSKNINIRSNEVQKQLSKITSLSQESFSGIKIIKSFNKENDIWKIYLQNCKKYISKQLNLVKIEALFFPLIIVLIGVSTILVVYIGGQESFKGKISIGNIAEFIIYVNMLAWPIASIGWVTSLVQRASASMKRINSFLLTNEKIKNYTIKKTPVSNTISFINVSFTYKNTNIKALDNVSFLIKKGQTVGFFGKTGSGKSTVAQLLCRLYDVDGGDINFGNINIKKLNLFNLRRAIGYVPQDGYLFSGSIKRNIAFGYEKIDHKKMIDAAKISGIYKEIDNFPNGFDTVIGERGVQLSGGQRQRLSIARMIYKEPKIIILDDCLSAVDKNKEKLILKNLKELFKDCVLIIISHRINSFINADNIIVIEKGKIKSQGSHNNLVKNCNLYSKIFNRQNKDL